MTVYFSLLSRVHFEKFSLSSLWTILFEVNSMNGLDILTYFFSVDDDKDYRFYDTVDVEDLDHVNSTDIPHIDLTQSEKKLKADLTKQLFAQTGRSSKKQHFARSYIYYLQNLMKQAENAILKAETMIPALDES